MKVVHFVLSDSFAGIEQHVDELLVNNLTDNPMLICNESIAKDFDERINVYKIKNISRRSIIGKYKLKKLLKHIGPDIVHTHGSKTTSIISSINKNKFKHIATVHGIKKNKKIYEKADFVVGVSSKAIEDIQNKSKVISNWWYPKLKKFKKEKGKYALAIGRLEKIKGFDLLISSWKNIDTDLLIIGSGNERQNLDKLIEKNNLSKKIKIIDNQNRSDLVSFYNNASVLIISSRDEGGPRVGLEALYLKVPVLSTNVGHMADILPIELLAEKNNQNSLQILLEKYVDNIQIFNQEAIFEFVEEEFSIKEKIIELQDTYLSVLNKS
mgnify:FL=1